VYDRGIPSKVFYSNYIQTYVERDISDLVQGGGFVVRISPMDVAKEAVFYAIIRLKGFEPLKRFKMLIFEWPLFRRKLFQSSKLWKGFAA
jgi:hypothetical protein